MVEKVVKTDFGQFTFLDEYAVVATAYEGVNIDAEKVQTAIKLIEQTLPGDYAMILERKNDYSIMPVEVYKFFASIARLKSIAIVASTSHIFLPDNMEQRIYGKPIEMFTSIADAHQWLSNSRESGVNPN